MMKIEKPLVVLHKSSRGRILRAWSIDSSYDLDCFLTAAELKDGDVLEFHDADQRDADPPGGRPLEIGGLARDDGAFRYFDQGKSGFPIAGLTVNAFDVTATASDTIHR
jgi:hypothetical protein